MRDYLRRLFKNNGLARGGLYIIIALATNLGDDLYQASTWLMDNRDTLLARPFTAVDALAGSALVVSKLVLAIAAAGNVIRAYMDQHLSRTKANNEENATPDNNSVPTPK